MRWAGAGWCGVPPVRRRRDLPAALVARHWRLGLAAVGVPGRRPAPCARRLRRLGRLAHGSPPAARRRARRRGRRGRRRDGGRAGVVEEVGQHRGGDPPAVGLAEAYAEAAADDHRLDVEQVHGRGDARPSASTARSISFVATLSSCSSARSQMPLVRRSRRCSAASSNRLVLAPPALDASGAGLHRRAPGVGLEAAAAPARAAAAALAHDGVADLAGAAAAVPRLAVEDQAAADAGAPEDAEQRAVGAAGAEHELGLGRDADVVAEHDLRAERGLQRRREREARVASRAGCRRARRCPRRRRPSPGEPTPTPRSAAGSTDAACAASVSAAAIAFATSAGPPLVGRRVPRAAEHAGARRR